MKILGSYPKTRLRRLRKSQWLRDIISENNVSVNLDCSSNILSDKTHPCAYSLVKYPYNVISS